MERTTFTRSAEPFSVNAFSLPPIIPPKLRGESVFNTESKKKTYSVNKGKSKMQGTKHFYVSHSSSMHNIIIKATLSFEKSLKKISIQVEMNGLTLKRLTFELHVLSYIYIYMVTLILLGRISKGPSINK